MANDEQVWCKAALYRFLVDYLPTYVNHLDRIDVPKLADSVGISRQSIYNWFHTGRLTPKNVKRLCAIANESENVVALAQADRLPPQRSDFERFIYAAA